MEKANENSKDLPGLEPTDWKWPDKWKLVNPNLKSVSRLFGRDVSRRSTRIDWRRKLIKRKRTKFYKRGTGILPDLPTPPNRRAYISQTCTFLLLKIDFKKTCKTLLILWVSTPQTDNPGSIPGGQVLLKSSLLLHFQTVFDILNDNIWSRLYTISNSRHLQQK